MKAKALGIVIFFTTIFLCSGTAAGGAQDKEPAHIAAQTGKSPNRNPYPHCANLINGSEFAMEYGFNHMWFMQWVCALCFGNGFNAHCSPGHLKCVSQGTHAE